MSTSIRELSQKGKSLQQRVRKLADDSDGVWRTVRGRRVFIKEGQSFDDALKSSLGGDQRKNDRSEVAKGQDPRGGFWKRYPNLLHQSQKEWPAERRSEYKRLLREIDRGIRNKP